MRCEKVIRLQRYFEGLANRTCWLVGGRIQEKGDLRMTAKMLTRTTEKMELPFFLNFFLRGRGEKIFIKAKVQLSY